MIPLIADIYTEIDKEIDRLETLSCGFLLLLVVAFSLPPIVLLIDHYTTGVKKSGKLKSIAIKLTTNTKPPST